MKWYIIKTFARKELKVKKEILRVLEEQEQEHLIQDIQVPVEVVTSIANKKKKERERVLYSGYVFIKTTPTQKVIDILREVPGCMGFLSMSKTDGTPVPLPQEEVDRMLEVEKSVNSGHKQIVGFTEGQVVEVATGPFSGYTGILSEIFQEKLKGTVQLRIFGRITPTEVSLVDLKKIKPKS